MPELVCYNRNVPITSCGDNDNVLATVCHVFEQERNKMSAYVDQWRHLTWYQQCLSVFNELVANVEYVADPHGSQLVRTPARLLYDGMGDCKSMAIYCACCLWALGADKVILRFVSFTTEKMYTHVYCVAEKDGQRYILDAVERTKDNRPIFNYARMFVLKKDFVYNR